MKLTMNRDELTITLDRDGTKLTVELAGRLDTSTSPELEAELKPVLPGITELVMELSKLDFITSAGLRVLLMAAKAMKKQGEMTVMNPNSDVMDIFHVTGFDSILNIQSDHTSIEAEESSC